MSPTGTAIMPKPKGRPKAKALAPRTTIINLKGSQELADWLEAIHRTTHIPKAVIVRLALGEWAENHDHPSIPAEGDE